jgi:hypothetical protein
MKMQLSDAKTVIMIFIASFATHKAMMNGNFSITGMCLSHPKSETELTAMYLHFFYIYA